MNRFMKTAIIIAAALIVAGVILSSVALGLGALDPKNGSNGLPYTEKNYTYNVAQIRALDVRDPSSDIVVRGTGESGVKIVCWESENDRYNINMSQDGRLSITRLGEKKWRWFDYLLINVNNITRKNLITVYVPALIDGDVRIDTASGAMQITDLNVNGNLNLSSSSGSISVVNISAKGKSEITNVSGDTEIENLSSVLLSSRAASGHIKILNSSVSGEINTKNVSGHINIVSTAASGDVTAESSSGDIRVEALNGANISLKSVSGSIKGYVSGSSNDYRIEGRSTSGRVNLPRSQGGSKLLRVLTTSGSIDMDIK